MRMLEDSLLLELMNFSLVHDPGPGYCYKLTGFITKNSSFES